MSNPRIEEAVLKADLIGLLSLQPLTQLEKLAALADNTGTSMYTLGCIFHEALIQARDNVRKQEHKK